MRACSARAPGYAVHARMGPKDVYWFVRDGVCEKVRDLVADGRAFFYTSMREENARPIVDHIAPGAIVLGQRYNKRDPVESAKRGHDAFTRDEETMRIGMQDHGFDRDAHVVFVDNEVRKVARAMSARATAVIVPTMGAENDSAEYAAAWIDFAARLEPARTFTYAYTYVFEYGKSGLVLAKVQADEAVPSKS